ncbi:MAG: NAD(+) diphosphatase [Xanthobacteraceae bacterium]|nr:MAG: NAD(+) diphosphatase [Xanthobacteraceae bacterium]
MSKPNLFPFPQFAFHADTIERAAHLRGDANALAARERQTNARALIVCRDALLLRQNAGEVTFSPQEARALGGDGPVFLGLRGEMPWFAYALGEEAAAKLLAGGQFIAADVRALALEGVVPIADLSAVAVAKSITQWHLRHRFCANCGNPTTVAMAGWRRDCQACNAMHFPRTDPVVIMLVSDGERCLLGRQSRFPEHMWSCLAGFAEPGETVEDAVRREVHEEAGIRCGAVRYFASQPWPYASSLMIGCIAEALTTEIVVDHAELEDARWFSREETHALIARQHPKGLIAPHPFAIAHHIMVHWMNGA